MNMVISPGLLGLVRSSRQPNNVGERIFHLLYVENRESTISAHNGGPWYGLDDRLDVGWTRQASFTPI